MGEKGTLLDIKQQRSLKHIRGFLHANPELSGKEENTAAYINSFLQKCNCSEVVGQIGGNGIIAIFDSGNPGPSLMFRAELDALPIEEINTFDYKSKIKGVAHKCGHDGHATILLGLAMVYAVKGPETGKVMLLFQPAEENGEGAKAVLHDTKYNKYNPDFIFALHNLPGYSTNDIICKPGSFTASVKSIVVYFKGKTSHAGEPEHGNNPAQAIAGFLQNIGKLSNNNPGLDHFTLITPVHIQMGDIDYGTSAGYGEVRLTIRAWNEIEIEKLANNIIAELQKVSIQYSLETHHEWTHEFTTNHNDIKAVELIKKAATDLSLTYVEKSQPFKWGEDFGLFTRHIKGAMFGLGSGKNHPALHNPDYDFPDEIALTGIHMFHQISTLILK